MTTRTCSVCKVEQPEAEFYLHSGGRRRTECRACVASARRRRVYGVTGPEFEGMLERQGGRCAICRTDDPGPTGVWSIDHHHGSGQVRGLLCNNCNGGIGFLKDDPLIIRAALAYVEQV